MWSRTGVNVRAQCVGGTSDISAGQLIDRTGVLLGLPFPAGKALDALASESGPVRGFPVKLNDLTFSLSGMENKVKALAEQGEPPAEIARFTLETVASAVRRATDAARKRWPGLPVLCSGGVASNRLLRTVMSDAAFAAPPVLHRQRHGGGHSGLAESETGGRGMKNAPIYSVTQVNQYIKGLLDRDGALAGLFVRGELSNYKAYPSGHHYFSLKDAEGAIRCVMFRREAMGLRFRPENGMKVVAFGRVTVFPRDGQYQLYCSELTPRRRGGSPCGL